MDSSDALSRSRYRDRRLNNADLLVHVTSRCSKQQLQRVEPVPRRGPADTLWRVLRRVSVSACQLARCRPTLSVSRRRADVAVHRRHSRSSRRQHPSSAARRRWSRVLDWTAPGPLGLERYRSASNCTVITTLPVLPAYYIIIGNDRKKWYPSTAYDLWGTAATNIFIHHEW